MPGIGMIGLSKLSVPRCFGAPVAEARLACVGHLLDRGTPKSLHLLGGDRSLPWELREHRRLGHDQAPHGVCGNDSSFAFWYAAAGIDVDRESGRARHHAETMPDLVTGVLTGRRLTTALGYTELLRNAAGLPPSGAHDNGTPPGPHRAHEETRPCP